jgi:hypothetical protein
MRFGLSNSENRSKGDLAFSGKRAEHEGRLADCNKPRSSRWPGKTQRRNHTVTSPFLTYEGWWHCVRRGKCNDGRRKNKMSMLPSDTRSKVAVPQFINRAVGRSIVLHLHNCLHCDMPSCLIQVTK